MGKKRAGESIVGKLIRYNRECESRINSALGEVREYKSWTLRRERCRQMEREIHRAYYRKGGIRFYGLALTDYVRLALPDAKGIEEMWIGGYNSSILHMREEVEELERQYDAYERVRGENPFKSEATLRKAIGYESCRAEIEYFRGECGHRAPEQRKAYFNRLRRHVEANKKAAAEAMRCREELRKAGIGGLADPKPKNLDLLEALRATLNDEAVGHLPDPGGQEAEEYCLELRNFSDRLQKELLNRFFPPDTDAKTSGWDVTPDTDARTSGRDVAPDTDCYEMERAERADTVTRTGERDVALDTDCYEMERAERTDTDARISGRDVAPDAKVRNVDRREGRG